MSVLNENQLLGAPAGSSQYQIQRSLRFNSADSAYLSRTPASAGTSLTTSTMSMWVKRSALGASTLFSAGNNSTDYLIAHFQSDDTFRVVTGESPGTNQNLVATTAVFRDLSAWYHFVVQFDFGNATSSDRIKLYVNGTRVTLSGTFAAQNYTGTRFNQAFTHSIGKWFDSTAFFNGYLADIHFIDGQALTPSSFGQTDATTGEWVPIAYTGTYGTNGFKLNFADNSAATAAALGKDISGNGNNWTPNNLSVTAGAGNDSLVDTPTSYGTDTGVGGEVRGNYCTLNALNTTLTLSNGNLETAVPPNTSSAYISRGSLFVSAGKWYWEVLAPTIANSNPVGIGITGSDGSNANEYLYRGNGTKSGGGSGGAYGATYSNDIIGIALDLDAGTLVFYKNGVSQGTAYTGVSGTLGPFITVFGLNQTTTGAVFNFGQRPFAYTAPSGFKALCDTNLPAPTIVKPSTVMDVKLWTGNGTSQTISGMGFSPDFVWTKNRSSGTEFHALFNTITGATNRLFSNATNAEATNAQTLTAFNSDGFSVGSTNEVNGSGNAHVAWCWDAGSSTVTNTAGTIQSSVRANASAGFSVVTYTGTGAVGGTVGHGLGVSPGLIICKSRTNSSNWIVWHNTFTNNEYLYLSSTGAKGTFSGAWGSSSPTSTVFGVLANATADNNWGNMLAYCFAPVAGYSAFGSYTGNGSATDGPFVYCGFRPRWVMVKCSNASTNWRILDAARDTYNAAGAELYPNLSNQEQGGINALDLTSNGFKIRINDPAYNTNAGTYVYAAFAEFPFQYARAR